MPARHNHLDQGIRPRGECAGCDDRWLINDSRVGQARKVVSIEHGLESLIESNARSLEGGCLAHSDPDQPHVHTCHLPKGHKSVTHQCPCLEEWKLPARGRR